MFPKLCPKISYFEAQSVLFFSATASFIPIFPFLLYAQEPVEVVSVVIPEVNDENVDGA